ncbi:MAG: MucB/RseB C-terminal domain-containing protein [Aeromonadaceae bacterium]|nr:MucB/RseB C-terminal domain-containing protein [Aeromonadaceae bacterium]
MRQLAWFFLAALLISFKASADAPSAEALLQQMQRAYHHYNFELSMVKLRQGLLEPMRFSHGQVGGLDISHLILLNGRPSEYLRRGDEYSFFESGSDPYTLKSARLPGLWSALLEMDLERVLQSYEPVVAGRNRIAGLATQVVRLVPRDNYKYGLVLWLEQQSGLLLRLDMIDDQGDLVEQFMGVDLRISEQPSPWLQELAKAKLPPAVALSEAYTARPNDSGWEFGWLPSGFKVVSTDRHKLALLDQPVDYVLLSDGLVDVSIYLAPAQPGSVTPNQVLLQGATSLLTFTNPHKVEVTVVGEIPALTARRIAESLQPAAVAVEGATHD